MRPHSGRRSDTSQKNDGGCFFLTPNPNTRQMNVSQIILATKAGDLKRPTMGANQMCRKQNCHCLLFNPERETDE